jgi:RNase P subunit RPR2
MRCSYCGNNLHTILNCPKTFQGQINRTKIKCAYCGSNKHYIDACPITFTGSKNRCWHENNIENDFIKD